MSSSRTRVARKDTDTVVQALEVTCLRIGATIDPGVPWTQVQDRPLLLALKSGNFGALDFFAKALAQVS